MLISFLILNIIKNFKLKFQRRQEELERRARDLERREEELKNTPYNGRLSNKLEY